MAENEKKVYPENPLTREETMAVLGRFFGECLKYWERTLKVDSDLSIEAYVNAIRDIPSTYPYSMHGRDLDSAIVDEFRISRYMDCYGRDYARKFLCDYPDKTGALARFRERFQQKRDSGMVVSATKQVVKEEPVQLQITGVTLLSKEEYTQNRDLISSQGSRWWLRSHDESGNTAACTYGDGEIEYLNVSFNRIGVRPALHCNLTSSNLTPGDKAVLNGQSYTALRGDFLLKDEMIGNCAFCDDRQAADAGVYKKSDVKQYVEQWYLMEFGREAVKDGSLER
jgi:hypothetical protein